LFKKNKVDFIKGFGSISTPNEVSVNLNAGGVEKLSCDKILIATGSVPSTLPGLEVDEKQIVTSTGALEFTHVPNKLVVIGGGVIGLEMGSVWARLGAEVTVVEFLDRIVPGVDREVADAFQKILLKQGFKFKLSTKVVKAQKSTKGLSLLVEPSAGGAQENIDADIVLVATGRKPFTKDLGLEKLGIKQKGLQIETDSHFKTSIGNIYAIGDCIAGPMLAHKAEEEGIAAVEIMAGKAGHVNYHAIPGVIYTHPEVATVGWTEEDLKKQNKKYRVGKMPFLANSRAKTNDDYEGFVKVISDAATDRLLGVHIIGPGAGEMIAEAVLGIEYGASAEDIARTCHAHPTLSEAMKEACMAAYDKPIHF